jgi:hypothetical protein
MAWILTALPPHFFVGHGRYVVWYEFAVLGRMPLARHIRKLEQEIVLSQALGTKTDPAAATSHPIIYALHHLMLRLSMAKPDSLELRAG